MMFSSKTMTTLLLSLAPFPMAAKLRGGSNTERSLQTSDQECYMGNIHGPPVYLNFIGRGAKDLGRCEGDCYQDSDCEDGLVCYRRGPFGAVPGCIGGKSDSSRRDYCINPDHVTTLKVCRVKLPLGHCEGDCDDDSDCEYGLTCYQRGPDEGVPGCIGGRAEGSNTDYCVKPSDIATDPQERQEDEECYMGYIHGSRMRLNFIEPDAKNLGRCEGDCDEDSDCEDGLVCYQRDPFDAVPGCVGGKSDGSRTDYCINPDHVTTLKVCKVKLPLGHCEGDCDDDSDCEYGLTCYQRGPDEDVPGCIGGRSDGSNTDYCVKPSDITTDPAQEGDDIECYTNGPRVYLNFIGPDAKNLAQCEGDCDEDNDCEDGLVCYQRDPFEAVPGCVGGKSDGSRTDYCIDPGDLTALKFCGIYAKNLGRCEGDCDEDSDCEDGLVCYQRGPFDAVPGCDGGQSDGSKTDYCIKPSDLPELKFRGVNAKTLGECEGDCDEDSDCEDDLVCWQRDPFEDVPGCFGGRSDASRTDYCVKPY